MYRVPGTNRQPITFDEHVTMWLETTAVCVKFVTSPLNPPTLPRDSMLRPPPPQRPESYNQPISPRQSELLLSPPLPHPQHLCPSATRWILALLWPQSRAIHLKPRELGRFAKTGSSVFIANASCNTDGARGLRARLWRLRD